MQVPPDARIRVLRIRVAVVAVLAAGCIETNVTHRVYTIKPSSVVMIAMSARNYGSVAT